MSKLGIVHGEDKGLGQETQDEGKQGKALGSDVQSRDGTGSGHARNAPNDQVLNSGLVINTYVIVYQTLKQNPSQRSTHLCDCHNNGNIVNQVTHPNV